MFEVLNTEKLFLKSKLIYYLREAILTCKKNPQKLFWSYGNFFLIPPPERKKHQKKGNFFFSKDLLLLFTETIFISKMLIKKQNKLLIHER